MTKTPKTMGAVGRWAHKGACIIWNLVETDDKGTMDNDHAQLAVLMDVRAISFSILDELRRLNDNYERTFGLEKKDEKE